MRSIALLILSMSCMRWSGTCYVALSESLDSLTNGHLTVPLQVSEILLQFPDGTFEQIYLPFRRNSNLIIGYSHKGLSTVLLI